MARIYNKSVSAVALSYALAKHDDELVVVWLELAPQHQAVLKAIWATLVNNTTEQLAIRDGETTHDVDGLHRRYLRLTADAPRLAGRARPKFLRLVAPEAVKVDNSTNGFIALAWPGISAGVALAAMLEQGTSLPIRIGWGDYLLAEAQAREYAVPLVTGGPAPQGYAIKPETPWGEIISAGIRAGAITLEGECAGATAPVGAAVALAA